MRLDPAHLNAQQAQQITFSQDDPYNQNHDQTADFGQSKFNNLSLIKEEDFKHSQAGRNKPHAQAAGSSILDSGVKQHVFQGN